MSANFDLLGDPIPEGWGKRGRPPHMPTDEKRRLVKVLLAFEWPTDKIAGALHISEPTLRKNYFRGKNAQVEARATARALLEAKLLEALMAKVEAGDVGAIDKMFKRLERHDMHQLAAQVANRGSNKAEAKPGKKQLAQEAAQGVAGKYATPQPPSTGRLVN